jgi:O-antigen/teichoic acid export membrane protein
VSQSKSTKALLLFNGNLVNFAISFVTAPFLARTMTYQDYGTYQQILMVGAVFQVVVGLGQANICPVALADDKDNQGRAIHSSLAAICCSSLAMAAITFAGLGREIGSIFANDRFFYFFCFYLWSISLQSFSNVITSAALFYGRAKQVATASVLANLARVCFLATALCQWESMKWFYVGLSLQPLIQASLLYACIQGEFRSSSRTPSREIANNLLTRGWPVLLTGLLGSGILYIDSIIIGHSFSVKEYAIYAGGALEFPIAGIVFSTVHSITLPELSILRSQGKFAEMIALKKRTSLFCAVLIYPIAIYLVFFSGPFLTLYLSRKYIESAPIFSIYSLALLTRFNDFQDLLVVHNQAKKILQASVASFIISVCLNLVLVAKAGTIGAAIAYVSSIYLLSALLSLQTAKSLNLKISEYQHWTGLVQVLLISLCFASLTRIFQASSPLSLTLVTASYFIAVYSSFWFTGLADRKFLSVFTDKLKGWF